MLVTSSSIHDDYKCDIIMSNTETIIIMANREKSILLLLLQSNVSNGVLALSMITIEDW